MLEAVVIAVIGALAVGAIEGARRWAFRCVDRSRVRRWLLENTRDEPGESHLEISGIASGIRLSEKRVLRACQISKHVFQSKADPSLWSVWREEPQSVYEKRGLLVI